MSSDNRARALPPVYVPRHGAGQLHTFQPGQSGNPGGRPVGMKDLRHMCRKLCPEGIEAIAKIVQEKVIDEQGNIHNAHEGKVVVAAVQTLLTWAYGKPPDYDPREDNASITINTAHLSKEDRALLLAVLRKGVLVPADAGEVSESAAIEGSVIPDTTT